MSAGFPKPTDPWTTARELTFAYGAGAGIVAWQQAEEHINVNDLAGYRAWRRLMVVLRILSRRFPNL